MYANAVNKILLNEYKINLYIVNRIVVLLNWSIIIYK